MKIVLSLFLIALSFLSAVAKADDGKLQREILDYFTRTGHIIDSLRSIKDYPAIVAELNRGIEYANSIPHELESQRAQIKAELYYNLACYLALLDNTTKAAEALDSAYTCGYSDYQLMQSDTDLANLRQHPEYNRILQLLKDKYDYVRILRNAAPYHKNMRADAIGRFAYLPSSDPDLIRVREYFRLDSVAGNGDEISRIKNILTHIHNTIKHDGQHGNPPEMNSIALAEACKDGSRGLNCRGLATVLNECYLAMGFPSRFITCMPKDYISDCHVINAVYSRQRGKWLWMDPTNNAWVMDENGNELGIDEVRQRIIDNRPLQLNEEANWNNTSKTTAEHYLYYYMAKNLYYLQSYTVYGFDTEGDNIKGNRYISLCPAGYTPDTRGYGTITTDNVWFWQAPSPTDLNRPAR